MLQHPSDWTKCRATQTKQSEAEHTGSVRLEEVDLLLDRPLEVKSTVFNNTENYQELCKCGGKYSQDLSK